MTCIILSAIIFLLMEMHLFLWPFIDLLDVRDSFAHLFQTLMWLAETSFMTKPSKLLLAGLFFHLPVAFQVLLPPCFSDCLWWLISDRKPGAQDYKWMHIPIPAGHGLSGPPAYGLVDGMHSANVAFLAVLILQPRNHWIQHWLAYLLALKRIRTYSLSLVTSKEQLN